MKTFQWFIDFSDRKKVRKHRYLNLFLSTLLHTLFLKEDQLRLTRLYLFTWSFEANIGSNFLIWFSKHREDIICTFMFSKFMSSESSQNVTRFHFKNHTNLKNIYSIQNFTEQPSKNGLPLWEINYWQWTGREVE